MNTNKGGANVGQLFESCPTLIIFVLFKRLKVQKNGNSSI